jgi:peptide/nickel transport system permease protein
VTTLIGDAFPNTLRLAITAFVISVAVGVPVGSLAAVHRDSRLDAALTGLTSLGLAIPAFWLGLMLILLFAVTLQVLPPSGIGNPGQPWYFSLQFLILPTLTIAVSNTAVFSRFVRSAMLDVLGADFVRTARAKGVDEAVVLRRHALRNALLPVATVLGIQFGRLLGGAVVTEAVFAYPGLGFLVVSSIQNRDYPVVQGALMLVVVIFLLTSMIVDVSYAYLDPRVTLNARR